MSCLGTDVGFHSLDILWCVWPDDLSYDEKIWLYDLGRNSEYTSIFGDGKILVSILFLYIFLSLHIHKYEITHFDLCNVLFCL